MATHSVRWTEASDGDPEEGEETEGHAAVDETFAKRRLRRWLRGMFGGEKAAEDRPREDETENEGS